MWDFRSFSCIFSIETLKNPKGVYSLNPKVQLKQLERDIEWLIYQTFLTKQTFNAVTAVSKVSGKTDALSKYGDYFAYSQNVMISEVQLQLSKLFVENKDSHSLYKIIKVANELFTEKYYKQTGYNQNKSYKEITSNLQQLKSDLKDLEKPIQNLKKIRNRDLAHLDKRISDFKKLEVLTESYPLYIKDIQDLISFSVKSLSEIKAIFFNINLKYEVRNYDYELEQIAKSIEEYLENKKE